MTEETIKEIIDLYAVPQTSLSYLSQKYNIDVRKLKTILTNHGVEIKNLSTMYTIPFDKTFFDNIDTEEKAYWLGFIYADGYITKNVFGIKLKETDCCHLERFKATINSEHKIGHYFSDTGFSNHTEYCSLTINNAHLVKSLIRCGVVYNKSNILTFPDCSIVPDHLVSHFIRGYFDGDGSVFIYNNAINISLEGTYEFLQCVLKIFSNICGTNAKIYNSKGTHKTLRVGGNIQVKQLYQYLYADATVFLGRKEKRFRDFFC